jgi:hypothetical protein
MLSHPITLRLHGAFCSVANHPSLMLAFPAFAAHSRIAFNLSTVCAFQGEFSMK